MPKFNNHYKQKNYYNVCTIHLPGKGSSDLVLVHFGYLTLNKNVHDPFQQCLSRKPKNYQEKRSIVHSI